MEKAMRLQSDLDQEDPPHHVHSPQSASSAPPSMSSQAFHESVGHSHKCRTRSPSRSDPKRRDPSLTPSKSAESSCLGPKDLDPPKFFDQKAKAGSISISENYGQYEGPAVLSSHLHGPATSE